MDSSWALRYSTVFVLVFLSSASKAKDEDMLEQHEVTFDLDKLIQGGEQPESFMPQKEVDWLDLLDPKEFPMQQEIVYPPELFMGGESVSGVLTPRGSRPRSFGGFQEYPVQFPLSRPTPDNIEAICLHGDRRPRYPSSYFPGSGFGKNRRMAAAVNNAEAWFSTCCKESQTLETDVKLCCATQAWELSVQLFCEEDSSVKDRLYHCCKRRGNDRLSCFNDDASNPNYEPTEVLPVPSLPSAADFIFEPNNCRRIWVKFPMQQEIVYPPEHFMGGESVSGVLTPRGSRPRIGPRSFGGFQEYPVQFPLSQPTSDNIQAICLHGDHRPRYPSSYFPDSGFGKNKRMAAAVNNAEAWFSTCCKENQTLETDVKLCCATQAWELSFQLFCEEDSSVKNVVYHCCKFRGNDRRSCVNNDASNPNYEPTEVLPVPSLPSAADFIFEPNNCKRELMTEYIPRPGRRKTMTINFPPGRPTADNIESLCSNQKLRPLYDIKCLPQHGFDDLARELKIINRLEKGFKQCCKKRQGVLNCADQKWHKLLHKFCIDMTSVPVPVTLHCCFSGGINGVHNCFQRTSPDPHYNMTSATEELSLNKICDTHNIIKKRFPVGFPLKTFVSQCCPLSEQDKTNCLVQKLDETSQNLCSSEKTFSPAVRHCCKMTSQEEISQCVSKIVMDAIANAAKTKRKKCPVS